MALEKIILVTRQTRLEGLIQQFNTRAQAKFYIEHSGGDFGLFEQEHQAYHAALSQLRQPLARMAKLHVIERAYLPNFIFSAEDLVVTIGIDGLVVNTAKYLTGQPLVAVNPDPDIIDGILLPFDVARAVPAVERALNGKMETRAVAMAEARLHDGQTLLAFNDLFVGRNDQISARYRISCRQQSEEHSSSGVIISTGAGSTGWLSSLFNMANGMMAGFGGLETPLQPPCMPWDSDRLAFVVREPFVSKRSGAKLVCGQIGAESPLRLESVMPSGGVIFSDGVASDFLSFNAGAVATIGLSQHKTHLVIG